MDPLVEHHFYNIANGKAVQNEDGSLSTVKGIIVEIDGRDTLIPSIWDGQEVSEEVAIENAKKSGVNWQKAFGDTAVQQLKDIEQEIKTFEDESGKLLMSDEWTPEEAQKMLDNYYEEITGTPEADKFNFRDFMKLGVAAGLSTATRMGLIESPFPYLNYLRDNFDEGGFLTKGDGMKGRSEEDKEIADEVEQVDVAEADTDDDGFVSPSEREVQLALQKNELVDEEELEKLKPVEAYHGGMMSSCDGGDDCTCGMDDPMVSGYDEVSGNPIPIGSSAENVRDDIPANLSTDEYVLPAHVVKWHGLKHIMEMQSEAEMGLMSMEMSGLIHEVYEEEPDSEGTEDTEVQASDDSEQKEAEAEGETSDEIPSEEMDVEVAAVEVDDHLNDEDEELYPMSQPLPAIMKKQKIVFAV